MISVVILSYNTRETTLKCLECLHRSIDVDWETIVVDNASTDGSCEAITKNYPQVKLIQSKENLGFSRGCNLGMKEAQGEWILLLNSDAFVFEDTLKKTEEWMKSRPDVSVVGCMLLNRDGTVQASWGYFPTLRRITQMLLFVDNLPIIRDVIDSIHVRSETLYSQDREVDWVTGAFVILKRDLWEKVGGLDEKFFMYGEEIEWMHRIKKAGFRVWYTPVARTVHLVGASSGDRAIAVIGEMKGWMYWFTKYNKPWEQKVLPFMIALGCRLRMWLKPEMSEHYRAALKEVLKK